MMGSRIRELRRGAGMTQSGLAQYLGVSASAVGMYEQDRRTPDIDALGRICDKFNVSADYLLFGKGETVTTVEGLVRKLGEQLERSAGTLILQSENRPLTAEEAVKLSGGIKLGAAMALGLREI
jgi:transcriptional regulator with XRE-family HTH domain